MVRFRFVRSAACMVALGLSASVQAGPGDYSGHSNDPGNSFDAPVAFDDPAIKAWAATAAAYVPAPGVDASFADATRAMGVVDASTLPFPEVATVSLGDLNAAQIAANVPAGFITLGFAHSIFNGAGGDFAVFENGFDNAFSGDGSWVFAELAYVEVSTDGVNFARFPAVSTGLESELDTTFGRDFAATDPTNIYNLAGKHLAGWGTPFDLDDLSGDALVVGGLVDLSEINFIRLVDIPGDGTFLDSLDNPIFDSWPTVGSGGLDLDAVGGIHVLPEPGTILVLGVIAVMITRRRAEAH